MVNLLRSDMAGNRNSSMKDRIPSPMGTPETNIAPENQWLEDVFPFGMAYFQGLC